MIGERDAPEPGDTWSRSRWLMVRGVDSGDRARRYDPFDGLFSDGRDAVEVGVVVQHGESFDLCRGSDQQVGQLDRSMMPDGHERLLHLDRTPLAAG